MDKQLTKPVKSPGGSPPCNEGPPASRALCVGVRPDIKATLSPRALSFPREAEVAALVPVHPCPLSCLTLRFAYILQCGSQSPARRNMKHITARVPTVPNNKVHGFLRCCFLTRPCQMARAAKGPTRRGLAGRRSPQRRVARARDAKAGERVAPAAGSRAEMKRGAYRV